uniref:Uncharacterized phage protein gp47/JayE n=1 Tax=Candidatus Kentrum sp. FM TaxID=2126340 RepID=A0A450RV24_9GAMM|nr:MAG: Uncharacterized phage protein gp47/JayE [Candidatus Kentron sp. FM]VFJ43701.1 MAG: Uncharacterized phage protein gp47/JayE [Candidatus Kentron sp. FM]VFK05690.1 MAG: Uncharacterized phage protein gp47/JayE [Candidatus Kentron sp. FM]
MTDTKPAPDFLQILTDSGVPATEEALKGVCRETVTEAGSSINNESYYSPFWRLFSAIMIKPVLWLFHLMVEYMMPQYFLCTADEEYIEPKAWDYGVDERKAESKTAGVVVFTREETLPETVIPSGTLVQSPPINEIVYELITTEDGVFSAGETECTVPAEATAPGSGHNLGTGYYTILPEAPEGIVSVTNPDNWITAVGADQETVEAYRWRTRAAFNTLSHYHTDGVYVTIVGQHAGVDVRFMWFEHNAPRGPGTANLYLLFELDAPAGSYLDAINDHITAQDNHGHGDDLQVFAMPEQEYDLGVTVWPNAGLLQTEKEALRLAVEEIIRAAFRENLAWEVTRALPYSRFSFSQLDREMHDHLPKLQSVEFDRSDIVSELWAPKLGNLTVALG